MFIIEKLLSQYYLVTSLKEKNREIVNCYITYNKNKYAWHIISGVIFPNLFNVSV